MDKIVIQSSDSQKAVLARIVSAVLFALSVAFWIYEPILLSAAVVITLTSLLLTKSSVISVYEDKISLSAKSILNTSKLDISYNFEDLQYVEHHLEKKSLSSLFLYGIWGLIFPAKECEIIVMQKNGKLNKIPWSNHRLDVPSCCKKATEIIETQFNSRQF